MAKISLTQIMGGGLQEQFGKAFDRVIENLADPNTGFKEARKITIIPSPARLKPFRTFVEVDQPVSSFVFRMKDDRCGGVQCALFEADGGAWTISAMEEIKSYLVKELEGYDNFIVIS